MDEKQFESLNMIPFIDIMLVLLTIVLTTSSFIARGKIPVNLPQASSSVSDKEKLTTIEITADGQLFLEGQPTSLDALRGSLTALPKSTAFVLRADKDAKLQRFVDVADLIKQLGFSKVAVQTEKGGH
jgi:biopolymer transport protein ExbD